MAWTEWSDLAAGSRVRPRRGRSGVTHVLVRGNDNRVFTRTSADGANFTGWQALPDGVITSAPTLCAVSSSELRVAARGGDGAAWVARYTGGAWQPFKSYGGSITGEVTLVTTRRRITTVLGPARYQTVVHLFAWSPEGKVLWARDGGATGGVSPFRTHRRGHPPRGAADGLCARPRDPRPPRHEPRGAGVVVVVHPLERLGSVAAHLQERRAGGGAGAAHRRVGHARGRRRQPGRAYGGRLPLRGGARLGDDAGLRHAEPRLAGPGAAPALRALGGRRAPLCRSEGSPFEGLVLVIDAPVLPMPGL